MTGASWQAVAASTLLRHTLKRQLAAAHDVGQVRRLLGRSLVGEPVQMEVEPWAHADGVGERLRCLRTPPRARLLYLHGGGFVACGPPSHRAVTVALARRGFEVLVPDYLLAPEHPFPQAVDQLGAIHAQACEGLVSPHQLALCGDSAGGGLAVSLMLQLRRQGVALPAAAALLSPFADLTLTGASIDANARRCAMFTRPGLAWAVALYMGGRYPGQPLASPARADLGGLPPLLIHVGADETLLDDSLLLAQSARRAGVSLQIKVWPAVPHVWQLFGRFIPEARQSLHEVAGFLHQHVRSAAA